MSKFKSLQSAPRPAYQQLHTKASQPENVSQVADPQDQNNYTYSGTPQSSNSPKSLKSSNAQAQATMSDKEAPPVHRPKEVSQLHNIDFLQQDGYDLSYSTEENQPDNSKPNISGTVTLRPNSSSAYRSKSFKKSKSNLSQMLSQVKTIKKQQNSSLSIQQESPPQPQEMEHPNADKPKDLSGQVLHDPNNTDNAIDYQSNENASEYYSVE